MAEKKFRDQALQTCSRNKASQEWFASPSHCLKSAVSAQRESRKQHAIKQTNQPCTYPLHVRLLLRCCVYFLSVTPAESCPFAAWLAA